MKVYEFLKKMYPGYAIVFSNENCEKLKEFFISYLVIEELEVVEIFFTYQNRYSFYYLAKSFLEKIE